LRVNVLLVESDARLARSLLRALSKEGYHVDSCTTAAAAITRVGRTAYALIILDWTLPDSAGPALCQRLREHGSLSGVLMLTDGGDPRDRVVGLSAGADDCMTKPFEILELMARMRALVRRSRKLGARFGPIEIDRIKQAALLDGARLHLTKREYELLVYLADHASTAITRGTLLAEIWGRGSSPRSKTVEVQVGRLRQKLGVHAGMLETVRGVGYRLKVLVDESSVRV
jgi:DNA-binding response OmpR family regulator